MTAAARAVPRARRLESVVGYASFASRPCTTR